MQYSALLTIAGKPIASIADVAARTFKETHFKFLGRFLGGEKQVKMNLSTELRSFEARQTVLKPASSLESAVQGADSLLVGVFHK